MRFSIMTVVSNIHTEMRFSTMTVVSNIHTEMRFSIVTVASNAHTNICSAIADIYRQGGPEWLRMAPGARSQLPRVAPDESSR